MFYADHTTIEIVAQLMIAYLFLETGIDNIPKRDFLAKMMAEGGTPHARLVLYAGFVIQFIGGAMLLVDWHAPVGAAILVVFTLAAEWIFHRWWRQPDPMRRLYHKWYFHNNLAVMGGLLLIARPLASAL
jgi:putative oxidoreductase